MSRGLSGEAARSAAGSATSAGLGLVRDLLVVTVLGLDRTSDRFFLAYTAFQAVYLFGVGGTALVGLQALIARSTAQVRVAVLRRCFRTGLLVRTAGTSLFAGIAALTVLLVFGSPGGVAVGVGAIAVAAVLCRTLAESISTVIQARGQFGAASFAATAQNIGVIMAAIASMVLGGGLTTLWLGVLGGYLIQTLALFKLGLGARIAIESDSPIVPATWGASGARSSNRLSPRGLGAHIGLTQGALLGEQAVVGALFPGGVAAVVLARRIVGGIATVLVVPLGNFVLVRTAQALSGNDSDASVVEKPSLSLYVTVALGTAFSASAVLVYATRSLGMLAGDQDRWVLISAVAFIATPGIIAAALHGVLSRVWHAENNARAPLARVGIATAIHSVGAAATVLVQSIEPVVAGFSLGWAVALWYERRALARRRSTEDLDAATVLIVFTCVVVGLSAVPLESTEAPQMWRSSIGAAIATGVGAAIYYKSRARPSSMEAAKSERPQE